MPSYLLAHDHKDQHSLRAIKQLIATKGKGWAVLRGILPLLEHSYTQYPTQFSSFHRLSRASRMRSAARTLHSLYDSDRKAFSYIGEWRERARAALGCCPYCGLPGSITLDHYLPRDLKYFPHYASLEQNLVPACFDCQTRKGNFVPLLSRGRRRHKVVRLQKVRRRTPRQPQRTAAPARRRPRKHVLLTMPPYRSGQDLPHQGAQRIIHPFYDRFLAKPVLTLRRAPGGERPLQIHVINCLPREQAVLRFHLRKLQVERRGAGPFMRFHATVRKSFRERKVGNLLAALDELPKLLAEAVARGGGTANCLEAVAIRHLSQDRGTLQELVDRAAAPTPKLELQSAARRTGLPSGSSRAPLDLRLGAGRR
jgi:5-methylcytosine-specific restriction endonuclease McrA